MKKRYALLLFMLFWQPHLYATSSDGKIPVMRIEMDSHSPLQQGMAIGHQVKQHFSNIERRYDAWLSEILTPHHFDIIRQQHLPNLLKKIDIDNQRMMQGIAGTWQLARESRPGDGYLSLAEYQVLNLLPDLGLAPNGVGLGVFGRVTTNKEPIVGHNLEWRKSRHIRDLQVITVYTGKDAAFVTIGSAGLVSTLQGFNQHGVFAALMNAEPYSPYQLNHSTSGSEHQLTSFSVRTILESSSSSIRAASRQLDGKQFAFSHSLLISDNNSVQVLEYSPQQKHFLPRYWDSPLHRELKWSHKQQIAAVDCLMLLAMPNTCNDTAKNTVRWQRLNTLMQFSAQQPASSSDVSNILFDTANKHYELFGKDTLHSLYFLPETNSLYLYTPLRSDHIVHHAYLNLLPVIEPSGLRLKWFMWPLILLMLGAFLWAKFPTRYLTS